MLTTFVCGYGAGALLTYVVFLWIDDRDRSFIAQVAAVWPITWLAMAAILIYQALTDGPHRGARA